MNPINAETAAAGVLTRQCRMAAGPTQEELSETPNPASGHVSAMRRLHVRLIRAG